MAYKSVKAVAELLGVHKNTIYRMVDRGEVTAYRIGRVIRIEDTEIEKLKSKNQVERMGEL